MEYTIEDVFIYCVGNELKNKKKLEANPEFMAKVVCRNKKFISNCSSSILNNPIFVKNIIDKYKDDYDFIGSIADSCMENRSEEDGYKYNTDYLEISVKMTLISEYNEGTNFKYDYKKDADKLYRDGQSLLNRWYKSDNGVDCPETIYSFRTYMTFYMAYKSILDYYANRYIEDMVLTHRFEERVHTDFSSYEEFEKRGRLNYLINFIGLYDNDLATYVLESKVELGEVKRQFKRIKDNWKEVTIQNKEKVTNSKVKSNVLIFVPKE